ncbi:nuclease-related domain-containing protein [Neobacillus sp. NRS-1170]|uniref:nuclease-related domain-containing protein n=1 Tax=Neobacillus sp. NRS-1170 TaxID=3233898 RepID=UPI003D297608
MSIIAGNWKKEQEISGKMKGCGILFAKEIQITPRIEKLEALTRRLSTFHPKWPEVMADFKGRMAGFRGEKSLGFYLSMLSDSKYLIFHGLRLLYRQYYFQMDFFLLCSAFGIVL